MHFGHLPFMTTDWSNVPATEHAGTTGVALWRTVHAGAARVRMVEYSPGYLADHWCERGHVLLVLEGQLDTELKDGSVHRLGPGTPALRAFSGGRRRRRVHHRRR